MRDADRVFQGKGEDAYRKHQLEHLDRPFEHGVAFPFVRRLLRLNQLYAKEQPVEVIVLSRNDPETGRRFFRSCKHYSLDITRGAFLAGKSPFSYIPAFNASLFLSANEKDVRAAIKAGYPAGLVLPSSIRDDASYELRVAFDFDGVLADDEAETVYKETNDLALFHKAELEKAERPHNPGPLKDLVTKISFFQKLEVRKAAADPNYQQALRIAIVTARNAPSNERFVTTLRAWGITADETFFLGGIEKARVLKILKPHIFFDDQISHLTRSAAAIPSVHIPFGIANVQAPERRASKHVKGPATEELINLNLPPVDPPKSS